EDRWYTDESAARAGDPGLSGQWAGQRAAPNNRDDVMLVQFFLKRVYQNSPRYLRSPDGVMVIDGIIGPITQRWINRFQLDTRNAGRSVRVDGIVNQAHGSVASISRTVYTIIHLNSAFKEAEPAVFDDLEDDPEVPPELAAAIRNSKAPASNV